MANKCAICGAEINVIQSQKLADGTYICRKTCRAKGFKVFDYVHASLPQVNAHIEQVEKGTKLWDHYFVPRQNEKDKSKKLKSLAANIYVAEDIGLMAIVQNDYKFFIFGKTSRACVYRIADLVRYDLEVEEVKTSNGVEKKNMLHLSFVNTDGMYDVVLPLTNSSDFQTFSKYFDKLFGIQKSLGNAKNNIKNKVDAFKSVASGLNAALKGDDNFEAKAANAYEALDKATYGDRTELIKKADAALSAFNG